MVHLNLHVVTFVEVNQGTIDSPNWIEASSDPGFLDGYSSDLDGYISDELFVSLASLRDGYYSTMLNRNLPADITTTVSYKLNMLANLGDQKFWYLYLGEMQNFTWSANVPNTTVTFQSIGQAFTDNVLPALAALSDDPAKVRLIVMRII